jgi:hypothetical protein
MASSSALMKNSGNILRADCVRARALRQGRRHAVTFRPNGAGLMAARTEGTMLISRIVTRAALVAVASIALSGCFDLTQSVTLDRDGAGTYAMAISATGFVGTAIKNGKSNVDIGTNRNVRTTTVIANGVTTRTSEVDFRSLSDISLSAESVSLHVTGRSFFGLGATHAVFRRTFHVGDAKKDVEHNDDDDATAQGIVRSIFGDHYYQFSVTLPGTIDWIAPVWTGDAQVKPTVSGNTITWRMPLEDMIAARDLRFSVGFSTWSSLTDAQSKPGRKSED